VTPNQCIDKMSGQSRKGLDAQRAELNKALDDALKPLTGKSPAEMEALRRRARLPGSRSRRVCATGHPVTADRGSHQKLRQQGACGGRGTAMPGSQKILRP